MMYFYIAIYHFNAHTRQLYLRAPSTWTSATLLDGARPSDAWSAEDDLELARRGALVGERGVVVRVGEGLRALALEELRVLGRSGGVSRCAAWRSAALADRGERRVTPNGTWLVELMRNWFSISLQTKRRGRLQEFRVIVIWWGCCEEGSWRWFVFACGPTCMIFGWSGICFIAWPGEIACGAVLFCMS